MLDPQDPEATIAAAAARVSNWGRWGEDDVLGTLNLLTPEKRVQAAALVRPARAFDLTQHFNTDGPQKGWLRRVNPCTPCSAPGWTPRPASPRSRTASAAPTT